MFEAKRSSRFHTNENKALEAQALMEDCCLKDECLENDLRQKFSKVCEPDLIRQSKLRYNE